MASTVSSRPNYYDALGLSPTASQDEIAKAFGKAMGLFGTPSVAAAAQLGIAFETLRNPAKRRAYDASIGLAPEPRPVRAPTTVSFRISARVVNLEPHVEQRAAERPAAPEPRREAPPESQASSFIASSLREIAKPVAVEALAGAGPKAEAPRPTDEPSAAALEQRPAERERSGEAEDRPIDWRRPAVAVGAVVLAAGLVGALAGVSVKDDEQGQVTVTAPVPALKPHPHVAAPAAAVGPADASPMLVETAATETQQPVRPRRFEVRPQRIAAPQPPASAATAQAEVGQAADTTAAPAQSDQAAADPLAPQPPAIERVAAAGLPLASKLAARTIDRIGYACGEIASATPAEGEAAGVYKVTCTSGQTYRAAPVHGRYRFRRWGSR
jgi:hypothetical protein